MYTTFKDKLMTKEDIITLPNLHLREKSRRVENITQEIRKIVDDMISATLDWDDSREHEVGVALAAVQIDRLYQIVIVRNDYEDKENRSFTVFINPEITKKEGKIVTDYEGCLSVPFIYGKVKRYSKVRVKAIGIDGKPFKITAEGFLARIFQHEIDHNKGKLFIDHIKETHDAFFRLDENGKLIQLDYEEIRNNNIFWE